MSAFRSHLMQQFAASAGRQSRPPLVMAQVVSSGSVSSAGTNCPPSSESSVLARESSSSQTPFSTLASSSVSRAAPSQNDRNICIPLATGSQRSGRFVRAQKIVQTAASEIDSSSPDANSSGQEDSSNGDKTTSLSETASAFQSILRSSRPVSGFIPFTVAAESSDRPLPAGSDLISSAIDRAVQCATVSLAPRWNCSEEGELPSFAFRRMTSPSRATDRLTEIARCVSARKARDRVKNAGRVEVGSMVAAGVERMWEKFSAVPAFLVATVGGQPCQSRPCVIGAEGGGESGNGVSVGGVGSDLPSSDDAYNELPLSPPETERQLEDYASTCAAVQNVLLSLHSEGVGSMWARGDVIRTMAFRNLVGARDDEAIVALIMAGIPSQAPNESQERSDVVKDVLLDL
eukprot:CAMPEP_0197442392 /NCGR_PEP_ID=MMETSP1175-20131217/8411_1 /TAXON_ID=1003142 /ORGANISM="Triceratium dubium, Strain CCMP147" /LENGTH=403 /DNA_ID=CAMNT_0042972853 /DNA_START=15 /DNA_END=1226 /DNA_ORIENTATION=+